VPYSTEFKQVVGYEADGLDLTMRLAAPVARVALRNLSMFCAGIVSPRILEQTRDMDPDAATAFVTQNPMGTGPFKLDAFDSAAKLTRLVANEGYWDGAPAVKTLLFKPVRDESTRTEYLTRSEGHFMVDDVPRQHWDSVEKSSAMELHDWWALNVCYLGMNAKHEATGDPRVRHAIQLTVDRAAVIEHYEGTARPTYSIVAQPMGEYDPDLRVAEWSDDRAQRVARARELVREAGAEGRAMTVFFPLQPRPYLPRPQDIADTVRQQLKEIGLDARIQGEDKAKLFPGVRTGQYELVLIGWMTDNGDPDNFYSPLTDGADGEPGENNTSRVFHPGVHAKIVAAAELTDAATRVKAYREIERMLQAEVGGYVPLVNTKQALAYSTNIEGIIVDPIGHYRFHKAKLR
jgi:peptide/nickel transport system substrate-binding protein